MRRTARGKITRRDRNVVMPPKYRSASRSSSRGKRTGPRMRMRPWLEDLLNQNVCSVLRWEDPNSKTFSIEWRHASSHGFDKSQHGDLFSRWAMHTGKSPDDHSNNKSTFRCALHSLKDCIELTKKGDKKGERAKRTYQFIEPGHSQYDRKKKKSSSRVFKVDVSTSDSSGESSNMATEAAQRLDFDLQSEESKKEAEGASPWGQDSDTFASNLTYNLPESVKEEKSCASPGEVTGYILPENLPLPVSLSTSSFAFNASTPAVDSDQLFGTYGFMGSIFLEPVNRQPAEVISLTIPDSVSSGGTVTQEMSPLPGGSGQLDNKDAVESYVPFSTISNARLSCGGSVTIRKMEPAIMSQPEFLLDFSEHKSKWTHPVYRPLPERPQYPVSETSGQISLTEPNDAGDRDTGCDQPDVNEQRVLTVLQPSVNDLYLSAMQAMDSDYLEDLFQSDDVSGLTEHHG